MWLSCFVCGFRVVCFLPPVLCLDLCVLIDVVVCDVSFLVLCLRCVYVACYVCVCVSVHCVCV